MKDKNGRDIKLGLKEARRIMATDYCVRSDLALCGEFFNEYGITSVFIFHFHAPSNKFKTVFLTFLNTKSFCINIKENCLLPL